ncbi:carboxymuconolactone decarboxylase family protein [bacterium]|nr:MAG: carboxymuconolactone decarboxylase family protein [bacterium]
MAIHLNHVKADPNAYKALLGVSEYVRASEIDPKLRHLIDIRVSQINGCAFCLDMHVRESRQVGETAQRIDTVAAWRDTPFFTPAERAALALAEHVTRISDGGVPDALEADLRAHYSETQIVQLLMVVIAINSWNRLSVSTGAQPPVRHA